jgi:CheY-like chemotaxis protein/HPt (histidine-containing phosphotransfer) domain-containing protein
LLAEDNAVNQKLALRLLEKQGHHVTVAGDGREALAALEQKPFDLVLMDVQMPEMNGFEATGAIRERERRRESGQHIPIIAMTAHAMKGDRERCLAAGMDDYVSKPIIARKLFEAIERLAPEVAQPPATAPAPILDAHRVLDRVEGDTELLRELVAIFLEDCPRQLAEIEEAVGRRDLVALASAAHALKGSIGSFEAGPVFQSAKRLEEIGREGDLGGVDQAWSDLSDAVARFLPALAALVSTDGGQSGSVGDLGGSETKKTEKE